MFDYNKFEEEFQKRGRHIKLDNGVEIFAEDCPGFGLAKGVITIQTGAAVESEQDAGAMHFVEHMLFEGSQQYTAEKRNVRSALLGLNVNASTSQTQVTFPIIGANNSEYLLSNNFSEAFRIAFDTLYFPCFDAKALEKERAIIQREREEEDFQKKSNPFHEINQDIKRFLFRKNAFLLRPIIGRKESIDQINQQTLRSYHQRYFVGNTTHVAIIGDLQNTSSLEMQIQRLMETLAPGKRNDDPTQEEDSFTERKPLLFSSPVPETAILFHYLPFPQHYHPDFAAGLALNRILFSPPLGIIYKALREDEKLVYSLTTKIIGHNKTKLLFIEYKLDPKKIENALTTFEEGLKKVKAGDFSNVLLDSVISTVLPDIQVRFQRPGWVLEELLFQNEGLQYGFDCSYFENMKKTFTLTKKDIIAAANTYFTDNNLLCILSS